MIASCEEAAPRLIGDEEDMVAIGRNTMGVGKVQGHRWMNTCSLHTEFPRDSVDIRNSVMASYTQ